MAVKKADIIDLTPKERQIVAALESAVDAYLEGNYAGQPVMFYLEKLASGINIFGTRISSESFTPRVMRELVTRYTVENPTDDDWKVEFNIGAKTLKLS